MGERSALCRYEHVTGRGVMHYGHHMHGALPLEDGHRQNLSAPQSVLSSEIRLFCLFLNGFHVDADACVFYLNLTSASVFTPRYSVMWLRSSALRARACQTCGKERPDTAELLRNLKERIPNAK